MKKIHNRHKILSVTNVCGRFVRLALDARGPAGAARPGQFLNVRINDGLEPFFRRPFGIYRANGTVDILFEVRGSGTRLLAQKKEGDTLDILGPLGNGFTLPGDTVRTVVLIAGGIGVAPLLSLTEALKASGKKHVLLYGARDKGYVFDLKDFEEAGCEVHIATDDGSVGTKGRVSELFDKIPADKETTRLYVCGPKPMMAAAQKFAAAAGLQGECSCEEVLACGIGACLGCVIETRNGYKTVCRDGPVFDLQEVIFEQLMAH